MCISIDGDDAEKKMLPADKKTLKIISELLSQVSSNKNEELIVKSFSGQKCENATKNEIVKRESTNKQIAEKKETAKIESTKVKAIQPKAPSVVKAVVVKPVAQTKHAEIKAKQETKIAKKEEKVKQAKQEIKGLNKPFGKSLSKNKQEVVKSEIIKTEPRTHATIVVTTETIETKPRITTETIITKDGQVTKTTQTAAKAQIINASSAPSTETKMANLSERLNALRQETTVRTMEVNQTQTGVIQGDSIQVKFEPINQINQTQSAEVSAFTSQQNVKEIDFAKTSTKKVKIKTKTVNRSTKYDEDEVRVALAGLLKTMTTTNRVEE